MKESTTAITVKVTSLAIFVIPKSVCQVLLMARTSDSPGSMATLARVSRYTPKPRMMQPTSKKSSFSIYTENVMFLIMAVVKSMQYPKMTQKGICSTCSSLKLRRRMTSCRITMIILTAMVNSPRVNGKFKLSTYGTEEIGDVPRSALVITLTPRELMNTPMKKIM